MQNMQNNKMKMKNIAVTPNVYQQLKNLGRAGDSFNDVLIKILSKQPGVYKIDV
jgi:predicted CopG family antitoxin